MNNYKVYIRIKGLIDTIYVNADNVENATYNAITRFNKAAVVKIVLL